MPNIIVNSNLIVCRQATRFPQALHGAIPTRRTWNSPENTFPWKVALEILNQTWGCGDLPCAKVGFQSNIARDIRFKPCDSFQTLSFVFYYGRFQQRGSVGQNRMICLSFALLYDQFPPFWLLRLPPWPIISTFIAASHFHCSGQITNVSTQYLSKTQMWTIWARGLS